jgi:tetratricopeptide (TPR) repeat protein
MIQRCILILAIFLLSACSGWFWTDDENTSWSLVESYRASIDEDERVALAKKRKSYITGIRKGDFYSLRNAPEEALSYYLSVQEKLPNDQVVRKKTAHVYFLMKNWAKAYEEYIKAPLSELHTDEKEELLRSLFFDESTFDRLGELTRLSLPADTLEYYTLVDTCYTGIHNCIITIDSYTGAIGSITELKWQIESAEKITTDYQYRNLLVAAKFYEQGMYRVTEKLLLEILKNRPDYTEIKKMLGFSLFHLGKYEEARKYILEYLELNPKDLESIIYLGELYHFLGDYISSNLYLNNAIIAWYTPKINLERRLSYNYALLWDTVGMLKVLNYLLRSDGVSDDDFAVAVSVALDEWELPKADLWAREGMARFPESQKIAPLAIEALRLKGEYDNASAIIQNTSEKDREENPNYLLQEAILLYDLGDLESAKDIFEELTSLEEWPEIVEESQIYLARIAAF